MEAYEDKNCKICFLKEVPCLYLKLSGHVENEQFRNYVNNGVRYFNEHKNECSNISIIIDASEFIPQKDIDIAWVNDEVITLLYIKNGIKIIALIKSKYEEGQKIADEFFEKTEQLHEIKVVTDLDEAKSWIMDETQRSKHVGDYTLFQNIDRNQAST